MNKGTSEEKKMTIFDVVTHLSSNNDDKWYEHEKLYNPYMINKIMSMRDDTIFLANEMNKLSHLPKDMQYDFYQSILIKKYRWFKYIKSPKNDEQELISNLYKVNEKISSMYLKSLEKDTIKDIKKMFEDVKK